MVESVADDGGVFCRFLSAGRGHGNLVVSVEGTELRDAVGVGLQLRIGPPFSADQIAQGVICRFWSRIGAEKTSRGALPGAAVAEVPPGNRFPRPGARRPSCRTARPRRPGTSPPSDVLGHFSPWAEFQRRFPLRIVVSVKWSGTPYLANRSHTSQIRRFDHAPPCMWLCSPMTS